MESRELNQMLISNFPNLQDKYNDEVSWQNGDSTGSHIVYGDVFTPYLVECITSKNVQEIKKAFNFLEKILSLKNKYSDEVVAFSVVESIVYLLEKDDYLKSFLGDMTNVIFKEITDFVHGGR